MNNLNLEKKATGSIIRVWLLTLLVLTLCTCSTPRLTLGSQTFGKQIDYSSSFGKHANPIPGLMECVILKTVEADSHLCPQLRQSTWLQYPRMHGTAYCPNLVPMLKRCSQIRWYQFPSTIPSFSNQYRTGWTGQRPNSPTESPRQDSLVNHYKPKKVKNYSKDLIQRSTGRTQVITPTMGRNSNSSSTMNPGNGKGPTTSSTTGELRKPPFD